MKIDQHKVTADHAGRTLLQLVRSLNPGTSDSRIYKACRKGEVRVNKARAKFSYKLQLNDVVRVPMFQPKIINTATIPEWLEASIIKEDANIIAINKPGGLSVHAGNQVSSGLIEILRQDPRWQEHSLDLIHRLDRATSGLILIAKNNLTKRILSEQFADRTIEKHYIAVLEGAIDHKLKTLKHRLNTNNDFTVICDPSGKVAITNILSSEVFYSNQQAYTQVLLQPKTGRKHQLRVQCQAIGHPILGDKIYGNSGKFLFLHAYKLCYNDPQSNERIELVAELPKEKHACLQSLKTIN